MSKNDKTIQKYVMEFYKDKKEETKGEIKSFLDSNKKLSITVDEWTDCSMRRFINITVHFTTGKYNLGLIKNDGKCTSEKLEELVTNALW